MSKRIPPEVYTEEYFLSDNVEGYAEFKEGTLSEVKAKQLNMLDLKTGMKVLEVGFGRGEFLYHCSKRGAKVSGIDYSRAAFEIAKANLCEFLEADLRVADCRNLPFEDNSFERVFSGDVIEHLDYQDGVLMLKEMHRVLKPGGFILIHTAPNTIFLKIVYPLVKPFLRIIKKDAIKSLDDHIKVSRMVHIHEYNLLSLRKVAREAGLLNPEVWLDEDILRSSKSRHTQALSENPLIKFIGSCGKYSIVRFLLGNDLYLKSYKL